MAELTEAQRAQRRQQARDAIENRLRDTYTAWKRTGRRPDFSLAADLALDSLGDLVAEILADGTLFKNLNIENGVVTLDLEAAREIFLTLVASMRTMLDSYGAENYLETEITAAPASVSLDVRDGKNPSDDYTVTIQRRTRPTPHEFRLKAEENLLTVMHVLEHWITDVHDGEEVDIDALTRALARAGHPVRGYEFAEDTDG